METTRRRFLGGLAVASALTGATAAAPASTVNGEDPALIKLGTAFEAAQERFLAASDRVAALQPIYRSQAPRTPDELVARRGSYQWQMSFTDWMSDPADPNYGRMKDEKGNVLEMVRAYRIEAQYGASFDIRDPKPADFTDANEIDLRLHQIATGYERATEAALASSGLGRAIDEYREAQYALRSIIHELCAIRARTLTGVGLKVRATAAFASFGPDERFTATQLLARAVWEDMGEEA
jgi:hypothetical protein